MYTLFYPAVLGFMIIAIVMAIGKDLLVIGSYRFFFVIFLAFYFSIQHVQNLGDYEEYNFLIFILDIFEIVLMFMLFYFIGITDLSIENDWDCFYIILGVNFLIPVLSRFCNKDFEAIWQDCNQIKMSFLSTAAAIFSFFMWMIDMEFNWILLALLYLLFLIYLLDIVFNVLPKIIASFKSFKSTVFKK